MEKIVGGKHFGKMFKKNFGEKICREKIFGGKIVVEKNFGKKIFPIFFLGGGFLGGEGRGGEGQT